MKPFRDATAGKTWATPRQLIDHMVTNHCDQLRMALPDLEEFADRAATDELLPSDIRDRLQFDLLTIADGLERHLSEQVNLIFPLVRHLEEFTGTTEWACELGSSVEWIMDRASRADQELLGRAIRLLGTVGDSQRLRNGFIPAVSTEELEMVCKEISTVVRLETEVLFPWVKELLKEEGLSSSTGYW